MSLQTRLHAELRAARRHGEDKLASRLEDVLEADDPAAALDTHRKKATGSARAVLAEVALEAGSSESDDPAGDGPGDGKRTWTEDEWQDAAKRTHEMDRDTFEDWETAKEEGRVEG
jgi:phosphoribosylaminoimidazole-succinocarboxamide synthase